MASANVKITIVGGSQALKELAGIEKGAQKAGQAEVKAARDAEKAAKKAADAQAREARRAAVEAERAAKHAGLAKTREAEKAAKDAQRVADRETAALAKAEAKQVAQYQAYQRKLTEIAAKSAVERAKDEEKSINARRKAAADTLRRAGGVVGALGAGAVAGGVTAMGTARGVVGVQDVGARVRSANEFKERLILTSAQAGLDVAGQERVQQQILGAGMASGKSPSELMGVLEAGQAQFNDLKFFADNLQAIAVQAKATGTETEDFARALGFAKQAFGLSGDEAMEASNLMVAAASKGSIEVKDFARDFAPVMGVFAQGTKMTGLSGFREMLGVSQAAGTLGAGSAETSTMVERLIAIMQNPERMKDLKAKTGIDVKGKTPAQFIDALAESARFGKPGVQADIFGGDIIANKAITALMSARARYLAGEEGAIDIGSISGVKASTGAGLVSDTMKRLESSGVLEMQRKAIEMENDTITHLEDYNDQLLRVVEVSNKLEKSFGTLSLWASSLGIGGAVSTVGSVLSGAGKAKAAADAASLAGTAVGAGGTMATLGTSVTALAGAGTTGVATLLGGAVAAGLAGYFGAKAAGADSWGEWLGNKAADLFGTSDVAGIERETKVALTTDVTIHDNRTEVKQSTKTAGASSFHTGRGPQRLDSGVQY